jgi:hypothetical protein
MTNWDYYESITRFQRVLKASGAGEVSVPSGAGEGTRGICGEQFGAALLSLTQGEREGCLH